MSAVTDERKGVDLELGPIDYLVLEFPAGNANGEGLRHVVSLVERGIVRVLDLVFLRKERDGTVLVLTPDGVAEHLGTDLSVFDGASSGLTTQEDIEAVAEVLEPDSAGVIVVYENSWAAPLVSALRANGAEVVASARIPVQALLSALETAESAG